MVSKFNFPHRNCSHLTSSDGVILGKQIKLFTDLLRIIIQLLTAQ